MATPQTEDGFVRIANELLEAIVRLPLSQYESRTLLCLIRLTYGWNRKEVRVGYYSLSKAIGIRPPHVARALKGLMEKNVITAKKDSKGGIYSIQKDYDKWELPEQGVPAGGLPIEGIPYTGMVTVPVEVIPTVPVEELMTDLQPSSDKGQREPKDSIKDIYKDISLRERLLKEMKKIFPTLSIPDFIPDEKLDFLIYKVGKGEIRADSIQNPLAYLKAMTVSVTFPSFLERETKAEKKRQEEREKRELQGVVMTTVLLLSCYRPVRKSIVLLYAIQEPINIESDALWPCLSAP